MSFQWIIDNAESISIRSLKQISSTVARDGTVKSTSRGYLPRQFEVKMPDGMVWSENRANILAAEMLDRDTATTFKINASGHNWLIGYQGSYSNITGYGGAVVRGTITNGSTSITLTTSASLSSGYKFKKGDFIQLGTGNVYQVAADVAYNSNSVTVDRPVREATATGVYIYVAQYCTFNVICTQFPSWTLFARDQIAWDGAFIFAEVLQ